MSARREAAALVASGIREVLAGTGPSDGLKADVRAELAKVAEAYERVADPENGFVPGSHGGDGMTPDTRRRVALIEELDTCRWDIEAFAQARGWTSTRRERRSDSVLEHELGGKPCQGSGQRPSADGRCVWCEREAGPGLKEMQMHAPYYNGKREREG